MKLRTRIRRIYIVAVLRFCIVKVRVGLWAYDSLARNRDPSIGHEDWQAARKLRSWLNDAESLLAEIRRRRCSS